MKKSQAKKVMAVLLKKNQKKLARTFAESLGDETAQKEFLGMIDEAGPDRNIKEKKGEGSRSGDDLTKRQAQNHPGRNVKKGGAAADRVGTEFDSRKRLPEVKKA